MKKTSWGESLYLMCRGAGGLNPVHRAVVGAVGAGIGARNTFAKLFRVDSPDDLNDVELLRAWLLLAALGENPLTWGVEDDVVPSAYKQPRLLRQVLRAQRG